MNRELSQIRWLPELGWKEVDLSRKLTAELIITGLKTHTIVENNGNLAVIAEFMRGRHVKLGGDRNVIFLSLGRNVETGMVLNGKLYRGRTNTAGEFGHTVISKDGRSCECGRKGCWVTYSNIQEEKVDGYLNYLDALSNGIVNIINITDPDLFIVGGDIVKRWDEFYSRIWDYIQKYALPCNIENLRLVPTSFPHFDASLIGAGVLGFWNFTLQFVSTL